MRQGVILEVGAPSQPRRECHGDLARACKLAEVGRSSHYRWLKEDTAYRAAMERARIMAGDILEAEAHRRAVEGVEEPVGWYKGQAGGTVRRYSDNLLIFLLKGVLPERYKDRMELHGAFANIDITRLPDDLIARLAAGENPVSVLAGAGEHLLLPAREAEQAEQ